MSELFTDLFFLQVLREFLTQITLLIRTVNWSIVLRVFFIFVVGISLSVGLLIWCDKYMKRVSSSRIKRHELRIVNAGNLSSVYLLRSYALPDNIEIRFRSNGQPMIWITRLDADDSEDRKHEEKEQAAGNKTVEEAPQPTGERAAGSKLIPDLNNPMKSFKTAENKVKAGARKTSRVSTFLSNVMSLINVNNSVLNKAASALKDTAQTTTQTLTGMDANWAKGANLINQAGDFVSGSTAKITKPGAADAPAETDNGSGAEKAPEEALDRLSLSDLSMVKNFTYDEETWRKNLTRRDKFGGSLIYAQSELIKPGEALDVEVEILNKDESGAPLTLGYTIEITQVPRSKVAFTAPRQTVDGVVTFPKRPLWKMILPTALTVIIVAISVQLISVLCLVLL